MNGFIWDVWWYLGCMPNNSISLNNNWLCFNTLRLKGLLYNCRCITFIGNIFKFLSTKYFCRNDRREHDLLQSLTEHEIDREQETSTLFRAASLTTTLLDLYMKSTCTEFLNAAVTDIIYKILESKQSCEVDIFFP